MCDLHEAAEELYRATFEQAAVGIVHTSLEGELRLVNPAFCLLSGYSRAEAMRLHIRDLTHPADIDSSIEGRKRLMHEHGPPYERELRFRRKDGSYIWTNVATSLVRAADGRPTHFVTVLSDISRRKRALHRSASRLRHISRRLLAVQEEERSHLSRELHDEFGQLLATISLHLHAARRSAGDAAQAALNEAVALLQRAGAQLRTLALELRPRMLESTGLDSTLRWLADQHRQRTGIATTVVGHLNDVSGDLAIACFRVVQEALTNVARHARAQHVWIELAQHDDTLELAVRDDGVGFDVARTLERAARLGNLGLVGMTERVEILGGVLSLDSAPGRGTRIRIALPAGGRREQGRETPVHALGA